VLFLEGDAERAVPELRMALRLAADNPQAHRTLAQVLAGKGDSRTALEHYRRALESQPTWAEALNDLRRISETAPEPSIRTSARALHRRYSF
jgi:Tfp pilus assembly protein PilF